MKKVAKNILIFGGSFDPVHQVHLDLLTQALNQFTIDQAFMVPVGRPTDHHKELIATGFERMKMLRLAIAEANLKNVHVSAFECRQQQASYTIDTINFFQKKFPRAHIYLIVGADQVINFPNWKKADEIATKTQILYADRSQYSLTESKNIIQKYHMLNLKVNPKNNSSSSFRICDNFAGLPKSVLNYINANGIYANIRLKDLSSKRFNHSLRVAQTAKMIALSNNYKNLAKKAYVAGLFHDYAKEFSEQDMLAIAKENNIKGYAHLRTLHGPVGACVLQKKLGFNDHEVLSAIFYHTEPFLNGHQPSVLEKIVYAADKIEIDRKRFFQNSRYYYKIRRLCFCDINHGFDQLYNISLRYFVKKELVTLK